MLNDVQHGCTLALLLLHQLLHFWVLSIFTAGRTGQFCESDIDHCAVQPCGGMRQCQSSAAGYTCGDCPQGYQIGSNPPYCENVNECVTGTHDCALDTHVCVDTRGGYRCACAEGYLADGTLGNGSQTCIGGLLRLWACICISATFKFFIM